MNVSSPQVPMIILYVFGIPVAAFLILRHNRNELHDMVTRRKYSFLYAVCSTCFHLQIDITLYNIIYHMHMHKFNRKSNTIRIYLIRDIRC
jgi:hypothetical protein